MNTAPRAILFDWDNTLVDGWAAIEAGLNAAFREFGLPLWNRTQVLANVRRALRESFPELFGADWERARDVFYAELRACHLQVLMPMPGAAMALEAGAERLPMGVVSNKQGPLLRAEALHLGWDRHFGPLIGAGDAAADKPSPAPILMALDALGLSPAPDIWYVGDTALDMQAARAAGLRAVLMGDAAHDGGIASVGADQIFTNCHDLAVALSSLVKPA
ncbi:MAG: HAD family hydrolase [Alphaproteobacteria bacterium]|nr:HAD family hydrolase [Alphaproteobacteria bacterium]